MATKTNHKQARVIAAHELPNVRYPLPKTWTKAIGILKGKKINPLRYQKAVRKGWGKRLKHQTALSKDGS